MTVKEFFKSTSFKCLAALLAILLVCGVFLTVAYGFLEVTEQERFDRALQKIYGASVTTEAIDLNGQETKFTYSEVLEAYKVTDDGNYMLKVNGKEGFGGDVVCWVVVKMGKEADGKAKIEGIKKVAIESAPGESYISKISQSTLDELAAKAKYGEGEEVMGGYAHGSTTQGDDYIATGASYSMRAISNCINGAMEFVAAYALGIVKIDFYTENEFAFIDMIDKDKTSYIAKDGVVTYNVVTMGNSPAGSFAMTIKVGENGVITEYTIEKDGSTADTFSEKVFTEYVGKDQAWFKAIIGDDGANKKADNYGDNGIQTGATYSNYLCLYAGLFATANYEKCLELPYGGDAALPAVDFYSVNKFQFIELIDKEQTTYTAADGVVTYTIKTLGYQQAQSFTVNVEVENVNGAATIKSFSFTDGSTYDFGQKMTDTAAFTGKTLDYFTAMFGQNMNYADADASIKTGATNSNYNVAYACAFALANYEKCIDLPYGGEA